MESHWIRKLSFIYGDRTAAAQRHESVSIARRFCHQLMALGYGRRELHPGDLPVRGKNLNTVWTSEAPYYRQIKESAATRQANCRPSWISSMRALWNNSRRSPHVVHSVESTSSDMFVRSSICFHDFFKYVAEGDLE